MSTDKNISVVRSIEDDSLNPYDYKVTQSPPKIIRDLPALVTSVMVNENISPEVIDNFNNDHTITMIRQLEEVTQRYTINEYWRYWFCYFNKIDTRVYRAGLISDGSVEEWLKVFNSVVLPGIHKISSGKINEIGTDTLSNLLEGTPDG